MGKFKKILLWFLCACDIHVGTYNEWAFSPGKSFLLTGCPHCDDMWVTTIKEENI
jgi:hypothetical protein